MLNSLFARMLKEGEGLLKAGVQEAMRRRGEGGKLGVC